MSSAGVTLKEIDQSVRIASSPGVYGAMVIPALKGPVDEPFLVTNVPQLLKYFTPNEKIEVGMDLSLFSAMNYLGKSDKLWVVRSAKQSKYSGASFRISSSSYNPIPVSSGLTDPTAYVFDASPDASAVAEVTQATFSQAGSFYDVVGAAKAIQLYGSPAVGHYFWFNVTDGSNSQTDPTLVGTAHQVDILSADTAAQVATKFHAAVAAVSAAFTATNAVSAQVIVTNVVLGAASNASSTGSAAAIVINTQGVDAISTTDEAFLLYGANQGAWANSISIKIQTYISNPDRVKVPGAFIIDVFKAGNSVVPVESWLCSRNLGDKDGFGNNIYLEDVLQGSLYIRAINNPAIAGTVLPKVVSSAFALVGGDNGLAVTDAEMVTSLNKLANKASYPLTIVMDGGRATVTYALAIDSLCQSRQDCVGLLSTPYSDESSSSYMTDIVDYRKTDLNLDSSYSALFTPHVKQYDSFNDRNLFISPDGLAGAAISNSFANFEIWFPPAGYTRGKLSVLDLRRRFTTGELDALYDAGINPIKFTPGKGIAIWGQKTLKVIPSALDRINVRLLLITIEPAIIQALEDFLFDLNDASTRSLAKDKVSAYMRDIQARRGVTEFLVVCDDTNNSAEDIDNNRMNLDLYVKPTRSLEFIPFSVIITASGVSFS